MTQTHRQSFQGYGYILVASVLFATYGVWSRLLGDTFPPFYQAWVRSALVLVSMFPFMWRAHTFVKIPRARWPRFAVYVAFCVCTQVPLYYAFNHAPIGSVQMIFYASLIVTATLFGRFFLAERLTGIKVLSIVLALLGLAVVFGVEVLAYAPLGLALAAFNGVASGGELASSKLSTAYPPSLLTFWCWAFTLFTHLPLSLLIGEQWAQPAFTSNWLWLIVYAVINAVAFWLVIVGFRTVDASIGSLIGLSEVVFAVLFGALIFRERLSISVAIGGVLILAAAVLPDAWQLRANRRAIRVSA